MTNMVFKATPVTNPCPNIYITQNGVAWPALQHLQFFIKQAQGIPASLPCVWGS